MGLALFLLIRFSAYEVVLAGVVLDALTGAPVARWHGIEFVATLMLVVGACIWYILAPYFLSDE